MFPQKPSMWYKVSCSHKLFVSLLLYSVYSSILWGCSLISKHPLVWYRCCALGNISPRLWFLLPWWHFSWVHWSFVYPPVWSVCSNLQPPFHWIVSLLSSCDCTIGRSFTKCPYTNAFPHFVFSVDVLKCVLINLRSFKNT